MREHLNEMLAAAITDRPSAFAEAFEAAILERVTAAIADKRLEVAASVFSPPLEAEEVECDGDRLDEISNAKLAGYVHGNARDQVERTKRSIQLDKASDDAYAVAGMSSPLRNNEAKHKAYSVRDAINKEKKEEDDKIYKRQRGMYRAVERLKHGGSKGYLKNRDEERAKRAAEAAAKIVKTRGKKSS